MWCKKASRISHCEINHCLVGWTVADGMTKWINVTEPSQARRLRINSITYFKDIENMPFPCLIVSDQAVKTSAMRAISNSGFSEMIHVQTSIPADMAEGVKTSNGKATV